MTISALNSTPSDRSRSRQNNSYTQFLPPQIPTLFFYHHPFLISFIIMGHPTTPEAKIQEQLNSARRWEFLISKRRDT